MRTPDAPPRRASAGSRLLVSLKSFLSGFKFCKNAAATRATDTTHRPAVRLHLESRFCTWKSVKDFSSVTTRHIVPDGCYTPLSKQLACQLQSTLSANAAADVPMPDEPSSSKINHHVRSHDANVVHGLRQCRKSFCEPMFISLVHAASACSILVYKSQLKRNVDGCFV